MKNSMVLKLLKLTNRNNKPLKQLKLPYYKRDCISANLILFTFLIRCVRRFKRTLHGGCLCI